MTERVNNYLIQKHDYYELNKHRKASAGRVVALCLIHFHYLILHLLLSLLVVSALVFLSDSLFLWLHFSLAYSIFLLLYTERQKYELYHYGEQEKS